MRTRITSVQTAQEVSAMLAIPWSHIMAGGTTFSDRLDEALHLVDISGLEGLDGIRQKGNRIEIGPLATLDALSSSPVIRACAPALAESAGMAATAEIRQRGTLGGNLAAERVGDTAPALLASGAKLTVRTDADFREIMIDRFWNSEGRNDLDYDEWITRITVQIPKEPFWGAAFGKSGEWDLSRDSRTAAAVQMSLNERGIIIAIRGGLRLGPRYVRRMFPLEKALKNKAASGENLVKAALSMAEAVREITDQTELSAFLTDLLTRALRMAEERRTL